MAMSAHQWIGRIRAFIVIFKMELSQIIGRVMTLRVILVRLGLLLGFVPLPNLRTGYQLPMDKKCWAGGKTVVYNIF